MEPIAVTVSCQTCSKQKRESLHVFNVKLEDIKTTSKGSSYVQYRCPIDERPCPLFLKKELVSRLKQSSTQPASDQ